MAVTKEQWFLRLKRLFPNWFTNAGDGRQIAHLYAIAAMLAEVSTQIEEHRDETFITRATEAFLLKMGEERGIVRGTLEPLASYRLRVQRIINQTNPVALKALIDAILLLGEATIIEDFEGSVFCNRENFCNRGDIIISEIVNAFSVIIDNQRPDPLSFVSREHFCDREDFAGSTTASDEFFDALVSIIDQNKALGTLYRLIERQE